MLTIGELSRSTGTNVSTIRYYEQTGLLTHTSRSQGNQRRYSEDEKDRLVFIRQARDLGITIESIRALVDLEERADLTPGDVDRIIAEQLATVRGKVGLLRSLEAELIRLARGPASDQRRIIRSLAGTTIGETTPDKPEQADQYYQK